MASLSNIKLGSYTSPSGITVEFNFKKVSSDVDLHATDFNAPDVYGTYVQQNGYAGKRMPISAYFFGSTCDEAANLFEALLLEPGIGKLDHPLYGTFDVSPFGVIHREDDCVEGINQAVVETEFFVTIKELFPLKQDDPYLNILSAMDNYLDALSKQIAANAPTKLTDIESFKNQITSALKTVKDGLKKISSSIDSIQQAYDVIDSSIKDGIDTLIGDPLTLAYQCVILVQGPARSAADIKNKLSAYSNLLTDILNQGFDFNTGEIFGTGIHSGAILSALEGDFKNKSEALSAAEAILSLFDQLNEWRENNIPFIDTGEVYESLHTASLKVSAYLIELSFTLKQEKEITLTRDRNLIELVGELYGGIDEYLDFFISSNKLSGSEILELKRGRKIVYYL